MYVYDFNLNISEIIKEPRILYDIVYIYFYIVTDFSPLQSILLKEFGTKLSHIST